MRECCLKLPFWANDLLHSGQLYFLNQESWPHCGSACAGKGFSYLQMSSDTSHKIFVLTSPMITTSSILWYILTEKIREITFPFTKKSICPADCLQKHSSQFFSFKVSGFGPLGKILKVTIIRWWAGYRGGRCSPFLAMRCFKRLNVSQFLTISCFSNVLKKKTLPPMFLKFFIQKPLLQNIVPQKNLPNV